MIQANVLKETTGGHEPKALGSIIPKKWNRLPVIAPPNDLTKGGPFLFEEKTNQL